MYNECLIYIRLKTLFAPHYIARYRHVRPLLVEKFSRKMYLKTIVKWKKKCFDEMKFKNFSDF